MRNLITIFLVAILILSCRSEKIALKSDLAISNLKGPVLKIEKTVHNATGKIVCPAAEKSECTNSIFIYNKEGNLTESSEIDENGKVMLLSKFDNDNTGACKEIKRFSGDELKSREVNTFKDGLLSEVKVLDEGGKTDNIYQYEYTGTDLSGGKVLNSSGEVVSTFHNEYLNGQLRKQSSMDKQGNPSSITTFTRNDKNDVIEYLVTSPRENTEIKVINEYEYDDRDNWIKKTQKYEGEIVAIIIRNITYYNS
jgi:hypothetical protein